MSANVIAPPKLRDWSELSQELELPGLLAIAVSTQRVELLAPIREACLTDDGEHEYALPLVRLVEVLIETNQELQRHAAQLAEKVDHIRGNLIGLTSSVEKLDDFANFRQPDEESDGD